MHSQIDDVRVRWSLTEQQCTDSDVLAPRTRNRHACCHQAEFIYMLGGKNGNVPLKDFWRFHIGKRTWEKLCYRGDKMPHLEGHTILSYKRILLVFGGEFGDMSEVSLWIINPDLQYVRKGWSDRSLPQPSSRRYHSSTLSKGIMYVFGGYIDIKGSSSELWAFNIDEEEWSLAGPESKADNMPGGRHGHSAVVHKGDMWIYGGMTDLAPKSELWSYNFKKNKWTKVKCHTGPPALVGHSACVVNDLMILFGGENGKQLQNDIWIFCFWTLRWRKIQLHGTVPSPRYWHTTVGIASGLFGESSDSCMKAHSVPHLQKKHSELRRDRPQSSPANVYTSRKNKNSDDKNVQDGTISQVMTLQLVESHISGPISKKNHSITDKSPLLSNEFRQLSIEGISSHSEPLAILNPNCDMKQIHNILYFENGHDENACIGAKEYDNHTYAMPCNVHDCSLKNSAHSLPGQIIKDSPKYLRNSVNTLNSNDSLTDLEIFLSCEYKNDSMQNPSYSEMTEMKCFSSNHPGYGKPQLIDPNDSFHGISVEDHVSSWRMFDNEFLGGRGPECAEMSAFFQDGQSRENTSACSEDGDKSCKDTDILQKENSKETMQSKRRGNHRNYDADQDYTPYFLLFGGKENKGVVGGEAMVEWKCEFFFPKRTRLSIGNTIV
ncbi:hypothetical protein ScPMuIL_015311 [Solemya velum]